MNLNLSFKHKILIGFTLPLIILISSICVLAFNINSISNKSYQMKNEELILSTSAQKLRVSVIQVQQWLTDISATRGAEGYDDGFKNAEQYFNDFNKELVVFENHYKKNNMTEKSKLISSIKVDFQNFYNTGKTMANLYIKEGPSSGNQHMETFDKAASSLDEKLTPFLDEQIQKMNSSIVENEQSVALAMKKFGQQF